MKKTTLLLLISFLAIGSVSAETQKYLVKKVYDGDTILVTDGNLDLKVRLMGIDAPEYKQKFGTRSKQALIDLTYGKKVFLKTEKRKLDPYNRILAHVFVGNENVGVKMISDGWAYYYRPYCQDYPLNKNKYNYDPRPYIEAENLAKLKQAGVWSQDRPQLPCTYRKKYKRKKH